MAKNQSSISPLITRLARLGAMQELNLIAAHFPDLLRDARSAHGGIAKTSRTKILKRKPYKHWTQKPENAARLRKMRKAQAAARK